MDDIDAADLLARCRREVGVRRTWRKIAIVIGVAVAILGLWMLVSVQDDHGWAPAAIVAVNGLTWLIAWVLTKRSSAIRQIERLDDPAAIGLLLDVVALGSNRTGIDDDVVNASRITLIRLLNKDASSGLDALEPRQRASACKMLKEADNPRFAEGLLMLLQRVGGEESVPTLSRFAEGKAKCTDQKTREVAEEALQSVKARLERESEAATLLRATDSAVEPALLRPAANAEATETVNLLRPM